MSTINAWLIKEEIGITAGMDIKAGIRENFRDHPEGGHVCKLCGDRVAHPRAAAAHLAVHHKGKLEAGGPGSGPRPSGTWQGQPHSSKWGPWESSDPSASDSKAKKFGQGGKNRGAGGYSDGDVDAVGNSDGARKGWEGRKGTQKVLNGHGWKTNGNDMYSHHLHDEHRISVNDDGSWRHTKQLPNGQVLEKGNGNSADRLNTHLLSYNWGGKQGKHRGD